MIPVGHEAEGDLNPFETLFLPYPPPISASYMNESSWTERRKNWKGGIYFYILSA